MLKTILFDFDGVLSNGRFYSTLAKSNPKAYAKITKAIFGKHNQKVVRTWMRGKISFEQLHRRFTKEIGIPVSLLNRALIDSVIKIKLNQNLMTFVTEARSRNITTAIFTDNMDIFDNLFVPYNDLQSKFDYIFSSSTEGRLKLDDKALFLRNVLKKVGSKPENTLLVDDSPKIGVYMEKLGGHFYLYGKSKKEYFLFRQLLIEKFDF